MNFIDRSAESLAKSIRHHYSEAGSEVALKYALSLLINTVTAITVSLLFCALTGRFAECAIGITAYTVMRYFTGGLHASSSLSCCILSIIIFITIAFSSFPYSYVGIALDLLSIGIFFITAPNDIKNISSIDPKYYPLLKLIAILLVSSNFFIHSTLLSAAFFIQAFLTTKPAYKIRDLLERR
jgi:accessory gene regulator B